MTTKKSTKVSRQRQASRISQEALAKMKKILETPIILRVLDAERDQLSIHFSRPGRVEIDFDDKRGGLQIHVYEGANIDSEQEPLGVYDGTLDTNIGWSA
jgi:hypothetical protein